MVRGLSAAFVILLSLEVHAVAAVAEVVLVKDGEPLAEIILPADPTPTEELAAEELRIHIRLIIGAELSVTSQPGTRVLIGRAAPLERTRDGSTALPPSIRHPPPGPHP